MLYSIQSGEYRLISPRIHCTTKITSTNGQTTRSKVRCGSPNPLPINIFHGMGISPATRRSKMPFWRPRGVYQMITRTKTTRRTNLTPRLSSINIAAISWFSFILDWMTETSFFRFDHDLFSNIVDYYVIFTIVLLYAL